MRAPRAATAPAMHQGRTGPASGGARTSNFAPDMLRSFSRHARPTAGTTVMVLGVLAALALHAPARDAASCAVVTPAAVSPAATPPAVSVAAAPAHIVRDSSGGEVELGGTCSTAQLPPLALVAAALAMLAVPRCRQGGLTEL